MVLHHGSIQITRDTSIIVELQVGTVIESGIVNNWSITICSKHMYVCSLTVLMVISDLFHMQAELFQEHIAIDSCSWDMQGKQIGVLYKIKLAPLCGFPLQSDGMCWQLSCYWTSHTILLHREFDSGWCTEIGTQNYFISGQLVTGIQNDDQVCILLNGYQHTDQLIGWLTMIFQP